MEDFIRFTELILTPKEAEIILRSQKVGVSALTVLKVILNEEYVYVITLRPSVLKDSIIYNSVKELLFPFANNELVKYKKTYLLNKNRELYIQYKALMTFWKMELSNVVKEFLETHKPSEYILDLTRLNF